VRPIGVMEGCPTNCSAVGVVALWFSQRRGSYEVLEGMHWVCFHYEFEHRDEYDVDLACKDPACPSPMIDPNAPADWLSEHNIE
jgi:hypothetical protein